MTQSISPVNIMLVDDHKLFRQGLRLLLSGCPYIASIEEADNGKIFLKKIQTDPPDIVFMDIDMPEIDGIEATKIALKNFPELDIIALSMYGEEHYYTQMIAAGAKGFILKNSDIDEVEQAIKSVRTGNPYVSAEILSKLLQGVHRSQQPQTNDKLTEREQEVLCLICEGLSNQQIADKLYLSKRTIDKHREHLLSKTGANNTAGLVIYAVKNGLIET